MGVQSKFSLVYSDPTRLRPNWSAVHVFDILISLLLMEKSEIALVRFDGKNYTSWAFQFQIYLEGKELWGYINGSNPKPKEDDKKISA